MDNTEFDNNIKRKLEQMESQPPEGDWDVFSEMLSAEEGFEDVNFDEAISERLNKTKKPFNSNHWLLLKQRLETEARLKREVFGSKILESVLVLLLVFTFFNLENYLKPQNGEAIPPIHYAYAGNLQYPDISYVVAQRNTEKLIYKKANLKAIFTESRIASIVNKSEEVLSDIDDRLSLAFTPLNIIKLNNNLYKPNSEEIGYSLDPREELKDQEVESRENVSEMKRLSSDQNIKYEIKEAYPMFYIKPAAEIQRSTYLSAYVNSDVSIIKSPGDDDFNLGSHNIYEEDFGFGLMISSELDGIEIGAGIEAKRISYNPVRISEITGGFRNPIIKRTLQKITFDVVSVPVNLKYHLFDSKKTHFWAGIGVAGNLAMFSDYDIQDEVISEAQPVSPPEEGSRSESILDQKNYHEGALSKGSFFDNMYLTGTLEAGIEHRATKNISFTAGLGYNRSFSTKGLGPNEDIFDAIRLGLGVKYQI